MSASNFEAVMDQVFRHEGGYVNHPRDPGGATNMGITKRTLEEWRGRAVSIEEVQTLDKAEAREIYRDRYWNAIRGDDLPTGLDLVAMDGAVNSGPRRGAQWLQRALGVTADGAIGPITLAAAVGAEDKVAVIHAACNARMTFLRGLSTFDVFGRGWSRRVSEVEEAATAMVS